MTLHWWMHWFWVTAQLAVILASPVPSTTEEPQTQGNLHREMMEMEENSTRISVSTDFEANSKSNFRIAKAIGIYPSGKISFQSHSSVRFQSNNNNNSNSAVIFNSTTESLVDLRENVTQERKVGDFQSNEKVLPLKFGNLKKDSKIMWILTSNKTNRSNKHYDDKDLSSPNSSDITNNNSNNNNNNDNSSNKFDIGEEGRVLPLQESKSFQSNTSSNAAQISFGNNNHSVENNSNNNQSVDEAEDIRIDESLAESQVLATAASVLDAEIGESTRLSRTRSAFTSGFQLRDQVQDSSEYNGSINESSNEPKEAASSSASNAVDIAAITGSCVATVVLLSTMGSLGFIMYRRRYLNPPQTLNSDKCSNPDSSGYIDDSTIRDNSEEMYSLDNDSFLNSLEAMTIQNYWTDSVKHTKL